MALKTPISPYRRGADEGFLFSVVLCALFFAGVFSVKVPLLGLVSVLLVAAVPFYIYKTLRKTYLAEYGASSVSSLWMQGIVTFACGCAVSGLIAIIYLKWIEPDFILDRIHEAIALYRGSSWDQGASTADILQRMLDSGAMPGAVQFVVEIIWLGIFSGSLLSLLMALLVRARGVPSQSK